MHPANVSTLYPDVASMQIAHFEQGSVAAGGFDITYWEAGEGAPLVVLHGAGGPNIVPAYERLAETSRVIYMQIPGFGSSPANDGTETLEELAETLAGAVAALGLDEYALLGTSFGGATACWLAALHPDRITELVLESPAAFRPGDVPLPDLTPEQVQRALYAHPDRRPPLPPPDPATMDKQLSFVRRVLAATSTPELVQRLRGLQVPTMVMFGTRDGLIPTEMGRRYKELIPTCDYVIVYDAAHAISSDRPEAFAELVADFLARREGHIVSSRSRVINR
jgi:pimeloyl-ACP methyl ester carboxylesterase